METLAANWSILYRGVFKKLPNIYDGPFFVKTAAKNPEAYLEPSWTSTMVPLYMFDKVFKCASKTVNYFHQKSWIVDVWKASKYLRVCYEIGYHRCET